MMAMFHAIGLGAGEAAYESTLCAAVLNAHETGCNRVFLASLGGGPSATGRCGS